MKIDSSLIVSEKIKHSHICVAKCS